MLFQQRSFDSKFIQHAGGWNRCEPHLHLLDSSALEEAARKLPLKLERRGGRSRLARLSAEPKEALLPTMAAMSRSGTLPALPSGPMGRASAEALATRAPASIRLSSRACSSCAWIGTARSQALLLLTPASGPRQVVWDLLLMPRTSTLALQCDQKKGTYYEPLPRQHARQHSISFCTKREPGRQSCGQPLVKNPLAQPQGLTGAPCAGARQADASPQWKCRSRAATSVSSVAVRVRAPSLQHIMAARLSSSPHRLNSTPVPLIVAWFYGGQLHANDPHRHTAVQASTARHSTASPQHASHNHDNCYKAWTSPHVHAVPDCHTLQHCLPAPLARIERLR